MAGLQKNVFWFQADKPDLDLAALFQITTEDNAIRVKSQHVECLYVRLDKEQFYKAYNYFNKYLHFDFSPILIGNRKYALSKANQAYLEQATLSSSIYFYTVNRLKLVLKPGKVELTNPIDDVIALLDKKYGVDTEVSVLLGARIVRTSVDFYRSSVKARRRYYDR